MQIPPDVTGDGTEQISSIVRNLIQIIPVLKCFFRNERRLDPKLIPNRYSPVVTRDAADGIIYEAVIFHGAGRYHFHHITGFRHPASAVLIGYADIRSLTIIPSEIGCSQGTIFVNLVICNGIVWRYSVPVHGKRKINSPLILIYAITGIIQNRLLYYREPLRRIILPCFLHMDP